MRANSISPGGRPAQSFTQLSVSVSRMSPEARRATGSPGPKASLTVANSWLEHRVHESLRRRLEREEGRI